jgi:hypothetical protein
MTFCTWDGAAGSGLFTAEFCVEIQLSRTHHQQPPGGSPVDGIKPANYFGDTTLASPMTKVAGSAMSTGSTVPSETTCDAYTEKLGLPKETVALKAETPRCR